MSRVLHPSGLFGFFLLLLLCCGSSFLPITEVSGQLAFYIPSTCPTSRFDVSSLSCVSCPTNSGVSASDPYRCQCLPGYAGTGIPSDAYSLTCVDCVAQGLAANRDRTKCIACADGVLSTTTRECVCPAGQALGQWNTISIDIQLFFFFFLCCSYTTPSFDF